MAEAIDFESMLAQARAEVRRPAKPRVAMAQPAAQPVAGLLAADC